MKVIVLAGGAGSRLWPFSNKDCPKQLLHFGDEESLLKKTLNRFIKKGLSDDLFIATSNEYGALVQKHILDFAPGLSNRILIEPCSRGTASAIAWALRHLLITSKAKISDNVLVVPSDHFFSDDDAFINTVLSAENKLEEDNIIAFGVKPIKTEVGFGYLRTSEKMGDFYKVDAFIEKPSYELAEKFSNNENWFWNSGMYLFRIETMLQEFKQYSPFIFQFMNAELRHEDYLFRSLSNISIDKEIMEKTSKLKLLKLEGISWKDVGSWNSLYDYLSKDSSGNVKIGEVIDIDTINCLIVGNKKIVAAVGLEDLIIVDANDTLFISKRSNTENLEGILSKLNERIKEKV